MSKRQLGDCRGLIWEKMMEEEGGEGGQGLGRLEAADK